MVSRFGYGTENNAVRAGYAMILASERDNFRTASIPGTHLTSVRPSHATRTFVPADGPTAGDGEPRPACEDADPEIFFQDNATRVGRKITKTARELCQRCPLRSRCLMHSGGEHGLWGGLTETERTW